MLGAVQSPEPAEKDEHDGPPTKGGKRDPLPGRAHQFDIGRAIADTQCHL